MTTAPIRLSLAILVALAAAPAFAEHEAPEAHAKGTTQTVILDGTDIRPSTTQMSHADVISFVNYSTHPVQVTFTEPGDLEKKIRCGLVRGSQKTPPSAPWALFTWRNGKLTGNVPPGQFASVCSLEPGSYTFTATRIGHRTGTPAPGSVLTSKGQLIVK